MMRFFIELMKQRWATSLQTVETTSVDAFKLEKFPYIVTIAKEF